jgi:geranylgeranyl pyrophosphate synthase
VDETRGKAREAVTQALDALGRFDGRADMLRELAKYIITRQK